MRVLEVVLLVLLAGQNPPLSTTEFSGTWVLDESQSILYHGQGGGALTYVVADSLSVVKITARRPDSEDSYAVPVDGKPHEHAVGAARFTRTLRRENGVLVFQITFTVAADQPSMSLTERWSLSAAGRTLTVHKIFQGGEEDLRVFTRKAK